MTRTKHLTVEGLQLLLDGALTEAEAASARAHLAGCLACRTLLDSTGSLFAALEGWEEQPLSRDLSVAVVRALRPAPVPAPWKLAWGLQLAAVLMALVVGWPLIVELIAPVLSIAVPVPASNDLSAWLADASAMSASLEGSLRAVVAELEAWLAATASAPYWWPLVLVAAVGGIVGNSMLLGRTGGFRSFRSGRL